MALPLSTEADSEEELILGSNAVGYSRLPADHVSDSSDSSYGLSDDPAQATAIYTSSMSNEGHVLLPDDEFAVYGQVAESRSRNHIGNGRGMDGMANDWAAPSSSDASYANVSYINARSEMQNRFVGHSIEGNEPDTDEMQNQAINSRHASPDQQILHVDGMDVYVYGQLSGLQLSTPSLPTMAVDEGEDDVDDVDERERQREEAAAILQAKEEEEACRSAPLPPERCQAIRNAMQNISLGGYRPAWADKIPEEQWINRLRRK